MLAAQTMWKPDDQTAKGTTVMIKLQKHGKAYWSVLWPSHVRWKISYGLLQAYGRRTWTLKKKERHIETFENKCIRKLLQINSVY